MKSKTPQPVGPWAEVARLRAKQLMTEAAEATIRGDKDAAEKTDRALQAIERAGMAGGKVAPNASGSCARVGDQTSDIQGVGGV
jgi:hypothetical protein